VVVGSCPVIAFEQLDQGSVLAVHCTKTALMRCDVQHNQKLSQFISPVPPLSSIGTWEHLELKLSTKS